MNWTVFLAIFSLSAFAAIHCLNETVNKPDSYDMETLLNLLKDFDPLEKKLETAISSYEHHKYTFFARIGNQFKFLFQTLKLDIDRLRDNSTIDDVRHNFNSLIFYQYLFPILSDPVEIGEAIKIDALRTGFFRKNSNFSENISKYRLSLEDTKEKIRKIIVEENKIKYNFNETNLVLDQVYNELRIPDEVFLYFTNRIVEHSTNHLRDYCVTNSCTRDFVATLTKFETLIKILNTELPINSDKKLDTVSNVLEKYREVQNQLEKLKEAEHIDCDFFKCFKAIKKQEN